VNKLRPEWRQAVFRTNMEFFRHLQKITPLLGIEKNNFLFSSSFDLVFNNIHSLGQGKIG
jgi:hypothetical protein